MRKIFYFIALSIISLQTFAQFTAGNLIALRVGDTLTTLSSTSMPVTLLELTPAGTIVSYNYIPSTGASGISLAGSATSEGHLNLATNQASITFFAYKVAANTATVASSTSATNNRVVVSLNAAKAVSFPTLTATNYSAGNPRAAITNGTNYWTVGSNTGICRGTTTANLDTIVSNSSTNIRVIGIFGNQMYYTTASGTSGVWRAGTGIPTSSGTIATPYINTGTGSSPYGFALNNDSTICYISDDRTVASGGGIQKWVRSGSTWTLAYTIGTGTASTVGARSLVVDWNTAKPTIYAVTAEATQNRIISVVDNSSTPTATTLTTSAANSAFRGVTFAPGTAALPVQFASFNAKKVSSGVSLNWSTASETNNQRFEIQRSSDNKRFETIGRVKGAVNSNTVQNYQFTDASPITGTSYYRIRQVDADGKSDVSKTVTVTVDAPAKTGIKQTLPNPFSNELNVKVNAAAAGMASIEVIDLLGKVNYSGTELLSAGDNTIAINTNNLSDGVYFVRVSLNGETSTQKIVKK